MLIDSQLSPEYAELTKNAGLKKINLVDKSHANQSASAKVSLSSQLKLKSAGLIQRLIECRNRSWQLIGLGQYFYLTQFNV